LNDFSDSVPIFRQIISLIKRDVASGRLLPGDKILSIREMSKELKVNPNTVQRAYQELEREDITITQRGTGVFICESSEKISLLKQELAQEYLKDFINNMLSIGFDIKEILKIIDEYSKSL